ncbi:MAG: PEP-CTERM sorting domain-containing protein [Desulfuromusa sp.]|nr:PEP-CTERM sorting domain-containing protein [Desulfuromusa sp.]
MKKMFVKVLVLISCMFLLSTASAMAISLTDEYELISPNPIVGMPSYTAGTDLGYFIWTDDLTRTSWHIRWSGAGSDTIFSGNLSLDGAEFDSFKEFSFESHVNSTADWSFNNDDWAQYFAIANVGQDGLDFTLLQTAVTSFLGFDLFINGSQDIGDSIFFGADNITAYSLGSDGDFKIAAPVPEPATLLLLGSGLVGLAFLRRRKS